ncbi:MAG: hypothetical protein ACI923_002367, partial [Flavobacteriales bacterium]
SNTIPDPVKQGHRTFVNLNSPHVKTNFEFANSNFPFVKLAGA